MTDSVAALITSERIARDKMTALASDVSFWAAERRQALRDLHKELGTWDKVADATGQTEPAVYKAASQPRKKQKT